MVARSSRESWDEALGASAQALAFMDRAAPLAHADAEAWEAASDELRAAGERDGQPADRKLEAALARAAAIPLDIAELAADVAALAALVGEHCDPSYRADTAAAAALAAGGARAAAYLVEVNLGVSASDQRLARALASADIAAAHADRVLATVR